MSKPYYQEKGIEIWLGDCREILPSLEPVDLVLTDPPYGIFACGGNWGKKSELQWDKEPAANVVQLIEYGENAIIWGGNYFALPPSRGWLVWYKRDAVPSASDVELAWTSLHIPAQLIDHPIAATNAERVGHPTQKPLAVMKWCIQQAPYYDLPQTILDPFMGSGTTLRAAKDLGRRAIGIEIEEKYCEIAAKRLSQEVLDFSPAVK